MASSIVSGERNLHRWAHIEAIGATEDRSFRSPIARWLTRTPAPARSVAMVLARLPIEVAAACIQPAAVGNLGPGR
ncbi:MAG: hypothetical protein LC114_09125 [Bryobacterales bacterium]|nr:hypothetical protein [Bryobacterales bacterium]